MQRKRYNVLSDLILKHKFTSMIEIGVGNGQTADFILNRYGCKDFIYCGVDPYVEYDDSDINSKTNRIVLNRLMMQRVLKRHKEYFVLHKNYSDEVSGFFKDSSIDLVFVDGNHTYDWVTSDITSFWSKIKINGILAFHDYDRVKMFPGVKKAVDEFIRRNKFELLHDTDVYYVYKV